MEIKRILCPVDYSDASAHAADQAVAMAGHYKASITALHVLAPVIRLPEEIGLEQPREETAAFFDAGVKAGIPVDVIVDVGHPVNCILDRAASTSADLIVMGTHGTGGFQHLVLGSVTEKVLRKATCPVLTVPPRTHATSRLPFTRLLCAVDFSEASLDAVRSAASLAEQSDALLTLLYVLEWPWEEPPAPHFDELPAAQGLALAEFRRYSEESAKKRLDSLVPASAPPSRVATQIRHGKAYAQILDVAAKEHADLIVIGIGRRNPVGLTVFGSTANQVVRRATCPVLTLR